MWQGVDTNLLLSRLIFALCFFLHPVSTEKCCDLRILPLEFWGACTTICPVLPKTNGSPCIPNLENTGIDKALRLGTTNATGVVCVYLTGFPKSGTSFATYFGAQIMRLGCALSGSCSTNEAMWPKNMTRWREPDYRPVIGTWSKQHFDPKASIDEGAGDEWRAGIVATSLPAFQRIDNTTLSLATQDSVTTGWDKDTVAVTVPLNGGNRDQKPIFQWTQAVTKHVGVISKLSEFNLIVPLRDPRMIVMSYSNWRTWKFGSDTMDRKGYFETSSKKVNNFIANFVEGKHRGGILFFKHSTVLEKRELVASQFAEFLGVRAYWRGNATDERSKFEELMPKLLAQLPTALEEDLEWNNTKSRLGQIQHSNLDEEAQSLCDWAGKAAVEAMNDILYGGSRNYLAALFPNRIECPKAKKSDRKIDKGPSTSSTPSGQNPPTPSAKKIDRKIDKGPSTSSTPIGHNPPTPSASIFMNRISSMWVVLVVAALLVSVYVWKRRSLCAL